MKRILPLNELEALTRKLKADAEKLNDLGNKLIASGKYPYTNDEYIGKLNKFNAENNYRISCLEHYVNGSNPTDTKEDSDISDTELAYFMTTYPQPDEIKCGIPTNCKKCEYYASFIKDGWSLAFCTKYRKYE